MKINVSNPFFRFNELEFEKPVCFIFGNNGVGKSSLATECIKACENDPNIKVMVYQGFEDLLGENKSLNAVILGEENKEIDEAISRLANKKYEKEKEIENLNKS